MQGDDIRNRRIQAEKEADGWEQPLDEQFAIAYAIEQSNLALWVIAEQLFELRSLIAIQLDNSKKDT